MTEHYTSNRLDGGVNYFGGRLLSQSSTETGVAAVSMVMGSQQFSENVLHATLRRYKAKASEGLQRQIVEVSQEL